MHLLALEYTGKKNTNKRRIRESASSSLLKMVLLLRCFWSHVGFLGAFVWHLSPGDVVLEWTQAKNMHKRSGDIILLALGYLVANICVRSRIYSVRFGVRESPPSNLGARSCVLPGIKMDYASASTRRREDTPRIQ